MESNDAFDNTDDDTFYDAKDESETDASSVKGKKKAENKGQEKSGVHFCSELIAIWMLLYQNKRVKLHAFHHSAIC